jgi:hypothetical protein
MPAASLTVADIEARITAIRVFAVDSDDYDKAREIEDALWEDVLKAVADGAPNAADLARAALDSRLVRYPR